MSRVAIGWGLLLCLAAQLAAADSSLPDPFPAEISRLIDKLGDPDPSARHAAAVRIREIGRIAIPQLRAAADSPDPEIQQAAKSALRALDRPPIPDGSGTRHEVKAVSYDDESSTIDIIDGKRKIRVFQKNGKYGISTDIKLTITGPVDGKQTTQQIDAQDAAHLKWEAPEVWKIYNRHFNIELEMAAVHMDHPRLEAWVKKQIRAASLSIDESKALNDTMKAFINAKNEELRAAYYKPELRARRAAAVNKKCDELRAMMVDLKFPSPPDDLELEPPARFRLGIVYSYDSEQDRPRDIPSGLVIQDIIPGTRAARLGIRAGDILQKVNGMAVDSGEDLWHATASREKGADADVIRDFKPVHLEEKERTQTGKTGDSELK